MQIAPFELETWFRERYFDTEIVLCVSGVEEFSLGEIRELVGISTDELDRTVFTDSPSYGRAGLRRVIAQRWRGGDESQVLVTHGSSEAIFLAMQAVLRPGDEVIVLTPCYQPLLSIPEAIGCTVKQWTLLPEQDFIPDIDRLKALVTPRTRMIVVNFPNNPTGATLTPEAQRELIATAAAVDAYLLWDSAFVELTYGTPALPDPWTVYPRTITLGTLTKTYGLGGLRVGWCLADPAILAQCVHLRDYITLNLSPLIELIGERVVEKLDRLLDIRLNQARTNLEILTAWMDEHRDAVAWVRPHGGVSAFVKLLGHSDVEQFCRRLADEQGVFLLPGQCFGFPEYLRLGFGGPTAVLKEGLARLSTFLRT